MRVTYTLTWDEFSEQYKHSWPRPDITALIMTLLIALPLIVYGVAFYFSTGGGEPILPASFVGGPLLLLVMAAWQIKYKAADAKKRVVKQKREEFEAFYAKEQSFSFDGNRWTLETAAGKQETPWSALRQAIEYQQTFALMGEKSIALVPKRVLDATTTDSLRQLALPRTEARWTFRVRSWDYQSTLMSWLWRKAWPMMAIANLAGLAVLVWIVKTLLHSDNNFAGWGTILAAFAAVAALSAQLWYIPLRFVTSAKTWRSPMQAFVSDRGVRLTSSDSDYFMAWTNFRNLEETSRAFILHISEARYYLLAKEFVPPEQQVLLRQMMQEKKQD